MSEIKSPALTITVTEVKKYTLTLAPTTTTPLVNEPVGLGGMLTLNGQPITGARVELYINNVFTEAMSTDVNGQYSFTYTFTAAGTYSVFTRYSY